MSCSDRMRLRKIDQVAFSNTAIEVAAHLCTVGVGVASMCIAAEGTAAGC